MTMIRVVMIEMMTGHISIAVKVWKWWTFVVAYHWWWGRWIIIRWYWIILFILIHLIICLLLWLMLLLLLLRCVEIEILHCIRIFTMCFVIVTTFVWLWSGIPSVKSKIEIFFVEFRSEKKWNEIRFFSIVSTSSEGLKIRISEKCNAAHRPSLIIICFCCDFNLPQFIRISIRCWITIFAKMAFWWKFHF